MPVLQGTGSFNTGRDCTVILIGPRGRLDIPNVTAFDIKAENTAIRVKPLDGRNMHASLPDGYTFTVSYERSGPAVDDEFAAGQQAWKTTGATSMYTLYQYVNEPDGSTSCYQLDNVALNYDDAGSWKTDASVGGRISGMGDNRRRV